MKRGFIHYKDNLYIYHVDMTWVKTHFKKSDYGYYLRDGKKIDRRTLTDSEIDVFECNGDRFYCPVVVDVEGELKNGDRFLKLENDGKDEGITTVDGNENYLNEINANENIFLVVMDEESPEALDIVINTNKYDFNRNSISNP